ncbi:hypothetical protein ACWEWX_17115, partial [Streptomyces asiaticus]
QAAPGGGAGAARSGDSYLPEHGNGGYRVTHYDLELTYRPNTGRLSGRARISAVAEQGGEPGAVGEPLSGFSLDLGAFRVDGVLVDGARPARYTHRADKLRIRPARPLPAGAPFTVEVRYVGVPRPVKTRHWGDLGWEQLEDGALVASQPIGAPSWFPCNDHPADKASYRIEVTAPSPYTVVAAGTLDSRTVGDAARSGRPPRETTAATRSGRSAAAVSAAAAPVLAPNSPTGSPEVAGCPSSQFMAAPSRRPSSGMSKRSSAVIASTRSSASVSRSNSRVARSASCNTRATARLRGLCRELPLPWANATTPMGCSGRARSPTSMASSAAIRAVSERIGHLLPGVARAGAVAGRRP